MKGELVMSECSCKLCKVVKETILHMSDCETMEEAIDYFEEARHKDQLPRTQELFDELSINQLAILFKLLLDTKQLELVNNKIREVNQRSNQ